MIGYPPLQIRVKTPRLELVGADDEMLAALAPLVRDGKVFAEPAPLRRSDVVLRVRPGRAGEQVAPERMAWTGTLLSF